MLLFSFPDGVNVATDEDETDRFVPLLSIRLGDELDRVETLLGLVIFVEDGCSGEVNDDMVPLEDAPEDVIEADIIEDAVIDELKFVDVEYPDVMVFEGVELLTPEKFRLQVVILLTMLLLKLLLFVYKRCSLDIVMFDSFMSLLVLGLESRELAYNI